MTGVCPTYGQSDKSRFSNLTLNVLLCLIWLLQIIMFGCLKCHLSSKLFYTDHIVAWHHILWGGCLCFHILTGPMFNLGTGNICIFYLNIIYLGSNPSFKYVLLNRTYRKCVLSILIKFVYVGLIGHFIFDVRLFKERRLLRNSEYDICIVVRLKFEMYVDLVNMKLDLVFYSKCLFWASRLLPFKVKDLAMIPDPHGQSLIKVLLGPAVLFVTSCAWNDIYFAIKQT